MYLAKHNVMVDLETMSTANNAAIISIGAVQFNEHEVSPKQFYTTVLLKSSTDAGLQINADTVLWWMKQSDNARSILLNNGVTLTEALLMFNHWLPKNATMWGNGATFDNVILRSAYAATDIEPTWPFWKDACYRTIKNLHPNIKQEEFGTAHNALDDAIKQANHLIKICNQNAT